MVDEGYITAAAAQHATKEPLAVVERALEAEAPYFVDFVGQTLAEDYPGLTTKTTQAVDVMTTLDLHLQRLAQDAVRNGLTHVDELLARRKRRGRAEAALIAVDPQTGEILAFVGGRSYNQIAVQPGDRVEAAAGIGVQAVRLPDRVRAGRARGAHRHHAGHDHPRRSGDVRIRRSGLDARELRKDLRRPDYLSTCPGAFAQSRDHSRRADGGLRTRRRLLEEARRRQRAEGRTPRSRSGCSRRRRTKSRRRTRCSPTRDGSVR